MRHGGMDIHGDGTRSSGRSESESDYCSHILTTPAICLTKSFSCERVVVVKCRLGVCKLSIIILNVCNRL